MPAFRFKFPRLGFAGSLIFTGLISVGATFAPFSSFLPSPCAFSVLGRIEGQPVTSVKALPRVYRSAALDHLEELVLTHRVLSTSV